MDSIYNEVENFLNEILHAFNSFLSIKVEESGDIESIKNFIKESSNIFDSKMNTYLYKISLDSNLNAKYQQALYLEKKLNSKYKIFSDVRYTKTL